MTTAIEVSTPTPVRCDGVLSDGTICGATSMAFCRCDLFATPVKVEALERARRARSNNPLPRRRRSPSPLAPCASNPIADEAVYCELWPAPPAPVSSPAAAIDETPEFIVLNPQGSDLTVAWQDLAADEEEPEADEEEPAADEEEPEADEEPYDPYDDYDGEHLEDFINESDCD